MKKYLVGVVVIMVLAVATWFAWENNYIPHAVREPSLRRAVVFSAPISEESKIIIRGQVAVDQGLLVKEPKNLEAWLDLAIQYKQAGDLAEAQKVWKYLDQAFPQQSTSAFNLGVTYHQDLKKYDLSEAHYREAIRRNPGMPLPYLGLHELYRYAYKQDTSAAVDILLEGLKTIPNEPNFPIALAAYYRDDKKDNKKSVEYIRSAIAILKAVEGDEQKIRALETEIARLQ